MNQKVDDLKKCSLFNVLNIDGIDSESEDEKCLQEKTELIQKMKLFENKMAAAIVKSSSLSDVEQIDILKELEPDKAGYD